MFEESLNLARDALIRTTRANVDGRGVLEIEYKDYTQKSSLMASTVDAVDQRRVVLFIGGEEYVGTDTLLDAPVVSRMALLVGFSSPAIAEVVVGDPQYKVPLRMEVARILGVSMSLIKRLNLTDNSDGTVLISFAYVTSTSSGAAAINSTQLALAALQNSQAATLNLGNVHAIPIVQIPHSTTVGPKAKSGNSEIMETWQIVLIVVFSMVALLLGCCALTYTFFRNLEPRKNNNRTGLQIENGAEHEKIRAESRRTRLQNEMEQDDLEAWWGSNGGAGIEGMNQTTKTALWDEDGMAPADASVHVLEQNMKRGMANPHYFPKTSNSEVHESQVWVKRSRAGFAPSAQFDKQAPGIVLQGAPPRVASFRASLSLPRGQPHFYPSASLSAPEIEMSSQDDDGWFNWDPDAENPQHSPTRNANRQMELATLAALEPVPRPELDNAVRADQLQLQSFEDVMDVERAQQHSFVRGSSVRSDGYLDDIVGDQGNGEVDAAEFDIVNATLRDQHQWGAPPFTGPQISDEFNAATSALHALSPPKTNLNSVRSARSASRGTMLEGQLADEFEFVGAAVVGNALQQHRAIFERGSSDTNKISFVDRTEENGDEWRNSDWAGNPVPLGQREREVSTPPPDMSGTHNALPYLDGNVQFHRDDDGEPKMQQP
jgi:hypothetical protein